MKNADATAASNRSKKNSDEEERSKRKRKAKSNKRRRIRDSSPSSSGSDDGPRARRKRVKRSERRKRDTKNPNKKNKSKKKTSRKRMYRSVSSSSSYSSRSCSTCRGRSSSSEVSRSPPPKVKSRTRSRSRGRRRDVNSERGRSRRRMRTSNGGRRDSRSRSQSCSTCRGSRSISPNGSKDAERRGRSCSEEKYDRIEQPRRLRSVLAMTEGRMELEVGLDGKDEHRDKIIQAYDDFDRYDERWRSDTYEQFHEKNAIDDRTFGKGEELVETNTDKQTIENTDKQNAIDDKTFGKGEELVETNTDKQTIENADGSGDGLTWKKSDNSGGSEAVDLESKLRQKALENFKKFRRSLSTSTRSIGCQEDKPSQSQCGNEAEDAFKSLDEKFDGSLERQESIQEEIKPSKPRVRSVVSVPAEEDVSNHAISRFSCNESSVKVNNSGSDSSNKVRSNLDQLKRNEETSNEISFQSTSPIKDKQENTTAEPGNSTVCEADQCNTIRQPTSQLLAHHKIENESEKKEEDTGSEFQQKTFSRMRDGELVQVRYKVYIPKKTPALARRQLRR
ncbi:hypothetical protein Cni_G13661 [Canna indica]|uniref:Uncharacterized protein n=1 Tax=Canna indica TaxID=4628 RepID=A0AAQ3K9Y1_9LILI|nr:hypothetical protein Cni_G13661 [Canna indica]